MCYGVSPVKFEEEKTHYYSSHPRRLADTHLDYLKASYCPVAVN